MNQLISGSQNAAVKERDLSFSFSGKINDLRQKRRNNHIICIHEKDIYAARFGQSFVSGCTGALMRLCYDTNAFIFLGKSL